MNEYSQCKPSILSIISPRRMNSKAEQQVSIDFKNMMKLSTRNCNTYGEAFEYLGISFRFMGYILCFRKPQKV